ncbi:class C beta-lactamase, partial [Vibrio parahaemolyticus]
EDTHIGYYRAGVLTQGLIWEQYPYPVDLPRLLSGNAPAYLYQGMPAQRLDPPLPPQTRAFINKTGSTNGFSAYAA